MLFGHDMFDAMEEFAVFLALSAIFATLARPYSYQIASCLIHLLLDIRAEELPGLEFKYGYEIGRVDQCFIFSTFFVTEHALVGALS